MSDIPSTRSAADIRSLKVRVFRVPTDAPESDGTLKWDSTTMVLIQLEADGKTGLGYTYSHDAAATLIHEKFREHIVGRDAMMIPAIVESLWNTARNLGGSGLVSQAVSAVDVALWDLKARLLNVAVLDLLGPVCDGVPIYGSGGFTSYSIEQLCDQLSGWVDQGIRQVKMKVGRHPDEDPSRVQAVRGAIGTSAGLFVDANGGYSQKQALAMAEQFAESDVSWFEEPVSSDDLRGLRLIHHQAPATMEITAGEYGWDSNYFRRMLEAEAVDVLMADATRCGGVTGFLKAAAVSESHLIPLSAHTAPNLHASICAALPNVRHVEYFHDHVRIEDMLFEGTLSIRDGRLHPDRDRPGLGLDIREADIRDFELN